MALQALANGMGMPLDAVMMWGGASGTNNTMDAAGESVAFIGKIYIEGAASSKTISSAGGKIVFRTGTVTFANAGTNFRVGIQDLTAGGLNDDTFDVYADFTGGGGGLATNTWYEKAMTNGTKTINHLQTVAIAFEMTARGGTDSVIIASFSHQNFSSSVSNFPYKAVDTGTGPVRSQTGIFGAMIIFDDGTLGWIEGGWFSPGMQTTATQTYNSGSTPDEYAAVFQVPFKCSVRGAYIVVGSIASTDNFEIILYSDAEGTPVAERTVTVDPNITGSASAFGAYFVSFSSYTLTPGLWYGVSMRPTTTNNLSLIYYDIGASFGNKYKKMLPFGTNCKFSSRTNQSGAFSQVQSYFQPIFGLWVDKLDDGVGGGVTSYIYLS